MVGVQCKHRIRHNLAVFQIALSQTQEVFFGFQLVLRCKQRGDRNIDVDPSKHGRPKLPKKPIWYGQAPKLNYTPSRVLTFIFHFTFRSASQKTQAYGLGSPFDDAIYSSALLTKRNKKTVHSKQLSLTRSLSCQIGSLLDARW